MDKFTCATALCGMLTTLEAWAIYNGIDGLALNATVGVIGLVASAAFGIQYKTMKAKIDQLELEAQEGK
jgi:hypothetical protein